MISILMFLYIVYSEKNAFVAMKLIFQYPLKVFVQVGENW